MLYLDGTVTAGAEDLAEPAPVAQVIEPGDEVVAGPSPEETTILPKVEVSSRADPQEDVGQQGVPEERLHRFEG